MLGDFQRLLLAFTPNYSAFQHSGESMFQLLTNFVKIKNDGKQQNLYFV